MQMKIKNCSSELAMEVPQTCPILMGQWQAQEEWWTKVNKRTSTTPKFFTSAEDDDLPLSNAQKAAERGLQSSASCHFKTSEDKQTAVVG